MKKIDFVKLLNKYSEKNTTRNENEFLVKYYNLVEAEPNDSEELLSETQKEKLKMDMQNAIWEKINLQEQQGNNVKPKFGWAVRIAAAILILGVLIKGVYFNNSFQKANNLPFVNISQGYLDSITDIRLILGESDQHHISNGSKIKYANNGNLIVNNKDTISRFQTSAKLVEVESLNTLIIPYGKRSEITLSDGSIIHLNAGTQFIFPAKFIGDKRIVYLSGEAFFEIAANKEKPFVVRTVIDKISIEVVGTKFNVSAYPLDKKIETVLTEGKVNILEKTNMLSFNKITALEPNQLASWNKEKSEISIENVDTDNYTLWIDGVLKFEHESISNIVKKLERFYNVTISYEKTQTINNPITNNLHGKLDLNEDIEKTLENLFVSSSYQFHYENNNKKTPLLK